MKDILLRAAAPACRDVTARSSWTPETGGLERAEGEEERKWWEGEWKWGGWQPLPLRTPQLGEQATAGRHPCPSPALTALLPIRERCGLHLHDGHIVRPLLLRACLHPGPAHHFLGFAPLRELPSVFASTVPPPQSSQNEPLNKTRSHHPFTTLTGFHPWKGRASPQPCSALSALPSSLLSPHTGLLSEPTQQGPPASQTDRHTHVHTPASGPLHLLCPLLVDHFPSSSSVR